MNLWKNTPTLDDYLPHKDYCVDPSEAEIAIVGGKAIDLDRMPKLRGIFKCGVGVDNIPFEQAKTRNIEICLPSETTRRIIFAETAHYTVYLILKMLYRSTGDLETWTKVPRESLSKKNVLIIGTGNIGRIVANALKPILTVDTYDALENQPQELENKIRAADAISLHIPLNNLTRNFIDAQKIAWMRSGAALINTARGPIVNEDALLKAISERHIVAAFDVFWKEPYKGPLHIYHPDAFFMSPHISSNSTEFLQGLAEDFQKFENSLTSKTP
ncbi:MAG: NAD(P)-dependent oxidoreductase [Verrucomicrobiota bacterium]